MCFCAIVIGESFDLGWQWCKWLAIVENAKLPEQPLVSCCKVCRSEDWLSSDTYKILLRTRSLKNHDCCLGSFEGGLLLVQRRTNPYQVLLESMDRADLTHEFVRKNLDKILPVVSFAEMHEWLSHSQHTLRFSRPLTEISSEEMDRRKERQAQYDRWRQQALQRTWQLSESLAVAYQHIKVYTASMWWNLAT